MTEKDRNSYNRLTKDFKISNSLDDLSQVGRHSLAQVRRTPYVDLAAK